MLFIFSRQRRCVGDAICSFLPRTPSILYTTTHRFACFSYTYTARTLKASNCLQRCTYPSLQVSARDGGARVLQRAFGGLLARSKCRLVCYELLQVNIATSNR